MSALPVVRGAIAVIWSGDFLLTSRRRPGTHLAGLREFPGGKINPGETPAQCVLREAREETGLEIRVDGMRSVLDYTYPDRRVILHPFDARIVGGAPPGRFCWLRAEELRDEEFPPATAPLLAELRAGLPARSLPPDGRQP